ANYVQYKLEKDRWCSQFAGHKSYCGPNLYDPERHTLYRNNGNGTFSDVTLVSGIGSAKGNGLGVVWVDADDDGKVDIFVANDQSPNFLWHNNGDGTFREIALESGVAVGDQGNAQAGMGIDSGDYDNDGRPDVLVTNFSEETNSLYHNEGGNFRDRSYASGMGAATLTRLGFGAGFLDYDRDGWLDMFFANGHVMDDIDKYSDVATWKQPNQLFRNTGDGKFTDVSGPSGIGDGVNVARGAAFGDLFNRGRTDVVVNVLRGKPRLMRNNCAPDAHWIRIDLKAKRGNPQGIGSVVTVRAGGMVQRRDIRMNTGYASSSDHRPLFGLGKATTVDEVRVRWADGTESIVATPPVDKPLAIEQPDR
ncbi:MAG: CRTAC1 family protein, partial [Armatimonadaceae bacterium]